MVYYEKKNVYLCNQCDSLTGEYIVNYLEGQVLA